MRPSFRVGVTPVALGVRRLRRRPLAAGLIALALAGAGALIGASSLVATLAQEESIRARLSELSPSERSLQVRYRVSPNESRGGELEAAARRTLRAFTQATNEPVSVQIWDPIAPPDETGIRLVEASDPQRSVAVSAGTLPHGCAENVCEALALSPTFRLGELVPLDPGGRRPVVARIVGTGSLRPGALPVPELLPGKALFVQAVSGPLLPLTAESSNLVQLTTVLNPEAVHGWELASLSEGMRRAIVRLGRDEPSVLATAPTALLGELDRSGRVARDRLLLIAGQGAALILAFAAFAATLRRDEQRRLKEQLDTFGSSRVQLALAQGTEVVLPAFAGAALAVASVRVAIAIIAGRRGYPAEFASQALPGATVLAIVGLAAVGAAILFAAAAPRPRPRFGVGVLEVAALTALALVVWQTSATSALNPEDIASGRTGAPILLLTPALAVFAAGVVLLRLLPPAFRLGERVARRGPFGLRLALLSAARNPVQAAAATTFLAVALGSALFSLNYRATLADQAEDAAAYQTGARWRIIERGDQGTPDVTPLTRYARPTQEQPTPVLRLTGTIEEAGAPSEATTVQVLGVPAASLDRLGGWRADFSSLDRHEIARLIRPRSVTFPSADLSAEATALRLWTRARTEVPHAAVLVFLLRGQHFERLELGRPTDQWKQLEVELPEAFRGGELVGIDFPVVSVSSPDYTPTDEGSVDLGSLEQRTDGVWSAVTSFEEWTTPFVIGGRQAFVNAETVGASAPVDRVARYFLNGSPSLLLHPDLRLPQVGGQEEPRFYVLSALVSSALARTAVDQTLTLQLLGQQYRVKTVGEAKLFPTVTEDTAHFAVFDYNTLFAALNHDSPGNAPPSEAWFFDTQPPGFASALTQPPFRVEAALNTEQLAEKLQDDPLAAGTSRLLTWGALAAALLALFGLLLATGSALGTERQLLAEYEALGVPPTTLARSIQLRLVVLSFLGLTGAVLGAILAVRLVSAFVAVTGTVGRPLPPIEPAIAWQAGALLLVFVAASLVLAAAVLATRALRETTARRLRA